MTGNIEDYALIGDLRTAALVGSDGSIDWLSLPRFDAPAVFSALLGTPDHGQWTLAPDGAARRTRRRYRPATLILETEWATASGAVRVTDFMAPGSPAPVVIRIVDGLVGQVRMHTTIRSRMDYGSTVPAVRRRGHRLTATAGANTLWLDTDVRLDQRDGAWTGAFSVAAGERRTFVLTHSTDAHTPPPTPQPAAELASTNTFWTEWASRCTYRGPWAEEVVQSLIFLKALTYAPAGSLLAAATTSLPEQLGGSRNWDYRYSWLRDATFSVQAFLATGYVEEAAAWRDWLVRTVGDCPGDVQIMYGIDGERNLPEQILDWLPGHAGSAPVRIGNAAAGQQQNDVWGEVLDALEASHDAGVPVLAAEEKLTTTLLDHLLRDFRSPDKGLWEIRGPSRHFTHSKAMAWVGLDRAVRMLERPAVVRPQPKLDELRAIRDGLRQEVLDQAFNPARGSFTQSYGSSRLDAAVLLLPTYGLLPWTDPRMVSTVDVIQRELTQDGLVLRYATTDTGANLDGLRGTEGTFVATSFWLADALHEMGRADEAAALFDRLLSLRNDVGMLSEEYDPATGHHLGNTPQAFSHAALVTTALRLDRPVQVISPGVSFDREAAS